MSESCAQFFPPGEFWLELIKCKLSSIQVIYLSSNKCSLALIVFSYSITLSYGNNKTLILQQFSMFYHQACYYTFCGLKAFCM